MEKAPLRVLLSVFVTITSTEVGSPCVKVQVMLLLTFATLRKVVSKSAQTKPKSKTNQNWDADGLVIEMAAIG
jgi:hypothetical protein